MPFGRRFLDGFRFVLPEQWILKTNTWIFPEDNRGCTARTAGWADLREAWSRFSTGITTGSVVSGSSSWSYFTDPAMANTVLFIHHFQDSSLIRGVHGCNRDIANSAKFTTVVKMLVLQPEEIPNKAPRIWNYKLLLLIIIVWFDVLC